jgi:exodeoxyribonuclease VII small subunit
MAQKKFEEAMKRLEKIVQELEDGDLSLEGSLKNFEEGMQLVKLCSEKLEESEQKVNILIKENNGKLSERPFDMKDKVDEE